MNPSDALAKLQQGNQLFQQSTAQNKPLVQEIQPENMSCSQTPFAVVLSCSDSRVPVELIFNQGMGDLFVVRVAGNVVTPTQLGSIEFACQKFGSQLVLVLGHTQCGAVDATINVLKNGGGENISPNIVSLLNSVQPAIESLVKQYSDDGQDEQELLAQAGRANVVHSVAGLRESEVLKELEKQGKLEIVGAEYDLHTGKVDFFAD